MRFRNYVLSIVGVMALGEPLAFAQSVGDTVVVTGTRTERLLRESPVYTEVITSEQIEKRHARDLKEALQYLPGIQLREIHGKSGYEVWIQGLNADRVLVLIDGLPVSPTTGSSVDVTQLSLLDVARVEAKSKLSQNREPRDYEAVRDQMRAQGKQDLARRMGDRS